MPRPAATLSWSRPTTRPGGRPGRPVAGVYRYGRLRPRRGDYPADGRLRKPDLPRDHRRPGAGRTANAPRLALPTDLGRSLRLLDDEGLDRLEKAVVAEVRRRWRFSELFPLRHRPAARRVHPLCASHHQAAQTGRLVTAAQTATASDPSSPAATDAATVTAPSANPTDQEPLR